VPEDWKLAEPPVCTPAISVVKYANGVVFIAEIDKLMLRDDQGQMTAQLPQIMLRYVETLPHVHYSAVGLNFSGVVECPNPEQWIIDRYLRPGPGNDETLRPRALGIKLQYPVDQAVLTLGCDAGIGQKPGEPTPTPCLLITGNYHTPMPEKSALLETAAAIGLFPGRAAHFDEISKLVFGLE